MQTLIISLILLLIVVVGYLFYLLDKAKVKENTNKKTIKELRHTIFERDLTIGTISNRFDSLFKEKEKLEERVNKDKIDFQAYVEKVEKGLLSIPNNKNMRITRLGQDIYLYPLFSKEASWTFNIKYTDKTNKIDPYATNN